MQKIFGLLFITLALWVVAEVVMEGPQRAFGGTFAFLSDSEPLAEDEDYEWVGERAGNKLRVKNEERADAIERMTRE